VIGTSRALDWPARAVGELSLFGTALVHAEPMNRAHALRVPTVVRLATCLRGHIVGVSFPAGSRPPPRHDLADVGVVHAVDGDGSSLCDTVAAGGLVRVDHFAFTDAPREQRCGVCEALRTG